MKGYDLKRHIENTYNWEILCWHENRFTKKKLLIANKLILKGSIKNSVAPNAIIFDLCFVSIKAIVFLFRAFHEAESTCKLDNDTVTGTSINSHVHNPPDSSVIYRFASRTFAVYSCRSASFVRMLRLNI